MNDSYGGPYGDPYGGSYENPSRRPSSGSPALATAAFVLSLISGASFYIFYISIPLAALAILLGLLSRGDGKARSRAKIAIMLGVIDLAASSAFTATAAYSVFHDPDLRAQFEAMWDYYMDYFGNGPEDGPIGDTPEFVFYEPDTEKLVQTWAGKGGQFA